MNIFLAPVEISNQDLLKRIKDELDRTLPSKVFFVSVPLDLDIVRSVERNQYFSTKLIAQAISKTDNYDGKVLILVDVDLYVPVFTFLFGEAQLNGKHSIVSFCRLYEEFYNGKTDNDLLFTRAMKEIYHELGHNYGLHHCKNWDCVMHQSTIIEEVDIKGSFYCDSCSPFIYRQLH
jgi:archaemetzincin